MHGQAQVSERGLYLPTLLTCQKSISQSMASKYGRHHPRVRRRLLFLFGRVQICFYIRNYRRRSRDIRYVVHACVRLQGKLMMIVGQLPENSIIVAVFESLVTRMIFKSTCPETQNVSAICTPLPLTSRRR